MNTISIRLFLLFILVTIGVHQSCKNTSNSKEVVNDYISNEGEIIKDDSNDNQKSENRNRTISVDEKFSDLKLALDDPNKVRVLRLREKGYNNFPDKIRQFTNLEVLDLSMNKIESIPAWIGEFEKLRILTIAYGPLKDIPESIGSLKNLVHLELLDNKINKLPESIEHLKELQFLNISANPIRSLPSTMKNLKKLEILGLRNYDKPSNVKPSEIERIKSELPNCDIRH